MRMVERFYVGYVRTAVGVLWACHDENGELCWYPTDADGCYPYQRILTDTPEEMAEYVGKVAFKALTLTQIEVVISS